MADKKTPKKKSYTKEEIQMMIMAQAVGEGNKLTTTQKKKGDSKKKR